MILCVITPDQLWFKRVEDDLKVNIIGARDEIRIAGWYAGTASQIEEFHVDENLNIEDARVEQPVTAMAAFHPLQPRELNLPPEYQEELLPVITQAWQAA